MKILILGGYGVLGSHLLHLLTKLKNSSITVLGKDKTKLENLQSQFKTISYIVSDIKSFECFDNFDIVINTSSSISFQDILLERIEKSNCDFFDCHGPSIKNFNLLKKYKNTNNTYLFECGATSFLPFVNLINPVNDLFVLGYFKTFWENKKISQNTYEEFENISEENNKEKITLIDRKWCTKTFSKLKIFDIGVADPMYNSEIFVVKNNIQSLQNIGFYFKMENADSAEEEKSQIILYSETKSVIVESSSGYYLTAAMIFSTLLEHLKFKKSGAYLMGEYVTPDSFRCNLETLNISIKHNL